MSTVARSIDDDATATHGPECGSYRLIPAAGLAGVGLGVIADPVGEDLLEACPLVGGGLPVAVQPDADRPVDRLELALPDAALERCARLAPRRRVDREPLRAGTVDPVVEYSVPHVVTRGDQVSAGVEARVDGLGRLVAGHAALGMVGDVGHPLVDHLERHRGLVERPGRAGVGEPDDLAG